MNLVDVVIAALLLGALVRGARMGAVTQVLAFAGFWIGLVAGSAVAPAVARLFGSTLARVTTGLVAPFVGGGLLGWAGEWAGHRATSWLRRLHLERLNTLAGSAVSAGVTLLSVWLVGFMLAAGPWPAGARAIHRSTVLRVLDRAMPSPPSVLARIQRLLDTSGFPPVFSGLEPDLAAPLPLPADPMVRAAVARAEASTVRVVGSGCGGILEGSGFVAGPGLVVTNAHVVAGIDRPVVEDSRGRHPATPVLFDPALDLAVLRAGGLAGPTLPLAPTVAPRGTEAAVLGYPGGGPFRAGPAAIRGSFVAVGRDIYGRRPTARTVYELQATVRPGNSGGPVVDANGIVLGVVFSRSLSQSQVGFALTSSDIAPRLGRATTRTNPAATGSCAA